MKRLVLLVSVVCTAVGGLSMIAIPLVDAQLVYMSVEMEESFVRAERKQLFDQNNVLKEIAAKRSTNAKLPLHGIEIQRELFPLERLPNVRRIVFIALIVNAIVQLLGGAVLVSTWVRMSRAQAQ